MQLWANRLTFCNPSVPVGQAAPLDWKITRSLAEFSSQIWVSGRTGVFWFSLNGRDRGMDRGVRAPHFHLNNTWNNMQLRPTTFSLSLSHPPPVSLVSPDRWRGGGRMWHQLVISSDKETCWMCFCIKKNLIPCCADFSCAQFSGSCLRFKIFKVLPFPPPPPRHEFSTIKKHQHKSLLIHVILWNDATLASPCLPKQERRSGERKGWAGVERRGHHPA